MVKFYKKEESNALLVVGKRIVAPFSYSIYKSSDLVDWWGGDDIEEWGTYHLTEEAINKIEEIIQ